jgi:hypothetical protein
MIAKKRLAANLVQIRNIPSSIGSPAAMA